MKRIYLVVCACMLTSALGAQEAPRKKTTAKPPLTAPTAAKRAEVQRVELDATVVTGNRELPKVLYIVPWKKADLGELPAQPFNTLLDEALTPIDRDVFRREVKFFQVIDSAAAAGPRQAAEKK